MGDSELAAVCDKMIGIPKVPNLLSPVLLTVVVQLMAYYTAKNRACRTDKPKNLAKSVTVE